jgi:hypothetical protein
VALEAESASEEATGWRKKHDEIESKDAEGSGIVAT